MWALMTSSFHWLSSFRSVWQLCIELYETLIECQRLLSLLAFCRNLFCRWFVTDFKFQKLALAEHGASPRLWLSIFYWIGSQFGQRGNSEMHLVEDRTDTRAARKWEQRFFRGRIEKEQQEVRLCFRDKYSILSFKDRNEIANFTLNRKEKEQCNIGHINIWMLLLSKIIFYAFCKPQCWCSQLDNIS